MVSWGNINSHLFPFGSFELWHAILFATEVRFPTLTQHALHIILHTRQWDSSYILLAADWRLHHCNEHQRKKGLPILQNLWLLTWCESKMTCRRHQRIMTWAITSRLGVNSVRPIVVACYVLKAKSMNRIISWRHHIKPRLSLLDWMTMVDWNLPTLLEIPNQCLRNVPAKQFTI